MNHFYSLPISEIHKETPNSVVITFQVPQNLKETFKYQAGQYLNIKFTHTGKELRRSYSLCSAANSDSWQIGIKKVSGGAFSVYANEVLKVGDVLEVMPPQGHFVLQTNPANNNHYIAFAAGSGITPVMSMIKTVLAEEPQSTFTLVYGNQSMAETMFYSELESLRKHYSERLKMEYFFSRESVEGCFFGRIERSMVNFLLKNKYKDVDFHSYYVCGPEEMIHEVKNTLTDKDISEKSIHFELFTSKEQGTLTEAHDGQTQLTVTVDDETKTFMMKQDKSVLEATLAEDLDAPYSCQGGICSTCIARVKEGKVEMRKNQILTDSELEEGLILTCQSHPTTPTLVVDYDDV
ncbi:MAG: ferredoxin--NADP reductase [Flavobacteriaceae bacterium]|nr:ferredoxin--NADP reductase [Flavobacteriaceae bacterium]